MKNIKKAKNKKTQNKYKARSIKKVLIDIENIFYQNCKFYLYQLQSLKA